MKNVLLTIMSLLFIASLSSCVYDPDAVPRNSIESPNGLVIDLEWYTGGSAAQSTGEVDLDLILTTGPEFVDASETADYEQVRIENFYRDGTYLISILYFAGNRNADYSLFARGTNSADNIIIDGTIHPEDQGVFVDVIEVIKTGTRYQVNPL